MDINKEREAPVYHLLSSYNSKVLAHGAWLASFIISIFAFMGLRLNIDKPFGWGSFGILFVLRYFSTYIFGRLLYYAKLVTCLVGNPIVEFFPIRPTMRDVDRKVKEHFKNNVKILGWKGLWWFAWQFRTSFNFSLLVISLILGVLTALFLSGLGLLVMSFG